MPKKLFISADTQDGILSDKKYQEAQARNPLDLINRWLAAKGSLKLKDKIMFFRMFSSMINAGLSIIKIFDILKDQVSSLKLKIIIESIMKDMKKGRTLSEAFAVFSDDFSEAEIGVVKSGESSGKLNEALTDISVQLEKSASITKKVKGAMLYPVIIFIILVGVIMAVMVFVIPNIKDMFESFDKELPVATQFLIDFSDFMIAKSGPLDLMNVFNILGGMILLFFIINFLKKTPDGKYYWDYFILSLPLFGSLNKKIVLSKMCRGISTLTGSGIPIVRSLMICADMVGNDIYKKRILIIAEDVKIGLTIGDNIKGDLKFFPPILSSMIAIGEQTAQLDSVSLKIAEFFEEEVDTSIKNLTTLLEPIIIVVVGLSVGGLVVAIMFPILSLSDLAVA